MSNESKSKQSQSQSKTAWLILSEGEGAFQKSLSLSDILKPINSKKTAKELWEGLVKIGFFVHPMLMAQYNKQSTCIFCFGQIVRIEGAGTYERRCKDCTVVYEEGEIPTEEKTV